MNRRRIGLAALVVGAGAAVRQRLKTRVDAGPQLDSVSPSAAEVSPSAPAPGASSGVDQTVAAGATEAMVIAVDKNADVAEAADSADESAVADNGLAAEVAAAPSESGATASNEMLAETSLAASPSTDLPAESGIVAPAVDSVSLGDPELSTPDIDTDPIIKLPTMPPAGSRIGEIPAVIVPSATDTTSLPPQDEPATTGHDDSVVPATALPLSSLDAPQRGPSYSLAPDPQLTERESAAVSNTSEFTSTPIAQTDSEVDASSPKHASGAATGHVTPAISAAEVQPGGGDAAVDRKSFYRDHRGWSIAGSILLGLVVVAVIAASLVRLPYYSLQPGSVYDTIDRVEAPGDLVSIPRGEIGFVTVAQTANITPWQWLDAKLDNNVVIRHEDEVRGDQTADELREADIRRMQVSKNSAVVVALRKLGFDLIITPIGIEVAQVFDCTAADGTLGTGDLIVGVNGVEVLSGEALVEQLMGQTIGAEVDLLIERIDPNNPTQSIGTELVAITLGSADADCLADDVRAEEPRPFIGIGTLPMFDEEFPIDIDVRTGSVSGPSAGLAFTLAIMDVLSEGELTNELNVVATGTIDRDGNVGPVGGIHQKTITAERSGADVFIVPKCCDNFVSSVSGEALDIPSNYDEALLYAEDMIVIGVDTIDEALIALGELGGDVDAFIDQTSS